MSAIPYYDRLLGRVRDDYGTGGGGGYDSPAFTSFLVSGQASPIEVGDQIAANPTFNWATTYPANVEPNSIDITDVTGSTILGTGLPNTGSASLTNGAIQKLSATTHEFRIDGENTNTVAFTRSYTVSWQWRVFYGEDASAGPLSEVQIEALRVDSLAPGFAATYAMQAGGYKYICYPETMGLATVFKDLDTGFDVAMDTPYTVSVTNAYGVTVNYRVHRTFNSLGGAINIVVS